MSAPHLRSRAAAQTTSSSNPDDKISSPPKPIADREDDSARLSLLDILRVLSGLFILSSILSYFITGNSIFWNAPRPAWTHPGRVKAWWAGPLHLNDTQLSLYNGTDSTLPILLALNGTIYDVSASPHLYGPGGSYHFFSGRDATRAFVTGCFEEDLNGDLRGVEEMFIPLEKEGQAAEEGGAKEGKTERKLRKEREGRVARKKVVEAVEGWRKMFDGGKGGRYFQRGKVDRGPGSGWEGWGEVKELCEKAKRGRGRRTAGEVGGK